jgi:tetratricopeptide (TPR) repeat protein
LATGLWAPLLLILAAVATYAPALRNQFVWDDQALILRDPLIRSWRLIGEGFAHFLFTDASGSNFYRPLQRLSYTIDYAFFFNSPFGYHLTSILWHAAATVALYLFALELFRWLKVSETSRFWIAFGAALAWAIHPVQSAAVVYVSGRADPLAACFGFLALFIILRMLHSNGKTNWSLGFGAGLCFVASALSKEIGLTFLLLGLVLALVVSGRRSLLGMGSVMLAVVIAYLSLRLSAERLAPPPSLSSPALVRPVVVARAVAEYAGLVIFPRHLQMERDVETHPFGFVAASLSASSWRELQTLLGLVLIGLGLYTIWRVRHRRDIALPLWLALISYLPVSGVVSLNATVAEHWLYLPSAFLFLAAAAALSSLGSKPLFLCLTIWLLLLSGRTFTRTFDWHDERTFFSRTIARGGESTRMLINLGGLELSEGHLEAAHQALAKALQKEPNNALAELNLAAVKLKERDYAGAREALKKVTQPPALRARAEETLAVVESRETGMINLMRLRLAARLGPPNWEIERRYIKALAESGFAEKAIAELSTCLTNEPYRAESWQMMGELLQKTGRPNEAAMTLAEAASLDIHLAARLARP